MREGRMIKLLSVLLFASGSVVAWEVHGPVSPTSAEQTAIRELKYYLTAVAGPASDSVPEVEFFVGVTPPGLKVPDAGTFAEEEWSIVPSGKQVVFLGGGKRGILYGVYHYIEEKLGVRWWNRQEEYIPARKKLPVPEKTERGKPVFMAREIFRFDLPWDQGRFQARHRMNRDGNFTLPDAYGGGLEFGKPGFAHTFEHYIPWKQYGESNPEFFSLVNGKRIGGMGGQLCLSNREVLRLIIQKLKAFIRESETQAAAAGLPPPRFYELSQNDNIVSCKCPECSESDRKWGVSGTLIRFLNEVGDAIEAEHPEVVITTLAYLQTEIPPLGDVKARPNVWIRLCDTMTSQAQSLLNEGNRAFQDRLAAWQRVTRNLLIWDYSITYPMMEALLPYPSEFLIAETLRLFANRGIKGVFFEHEFPFASDMYDLKVYMEAKLLENPYRDANVLYQEFLQLYYGPGAAAVDFYRRSLWDGAKRARPHIPFGSAATKVYASMLPLPGLLEVHRRFDEAEKLLHQQPVYLRRLHRARLGLDFLSFKGSSIYRTQWKETGHAPETYPLAAEVLKQRLLKTCSELETGYPEITAHYSFRPVFETALRAIEKNSEIILKNGNQVPAGFEKRSHTAYSALDFTLFDGGSAQWEIVYDDDAETGVTARIADIVTGSYSLPLEAGVYNSREKRVVSSMRFPDQKVLQPGYHWYHFTADLDSSCNFYFTRTWTLQLSFSNIRPGRYRVWCRAAYHRERDRNTIRMERVLVEPIRK